MRFFLSFFRRARMSFDISFPRFLGLSDSESELEELEELELLPPGGGLGGGTTPVGGLLSLDSIVFALGIEPLPDRSLRGGAGRSYSDSAPSLSGMGTLPHQAHCSRTLSMTEVTSMSLWDYWADWNWGFSSSMMDWSSSRNDFRISSHSCWETADALTWSCYSCCWRRFSFRRSFLTFSWSALAFTSRACISEAHHWQSLLNFSCLAAWSL
jgi:hypothetical protein